MRDKIRNFELKLVRAEVYIAIGLVIALLTLSFSAMVGRTFLQGISKVFVSYNEKVTLSLPHLILLLGFVSASIGITRREVIQMDILKKIYPEKIKAVWTFLSFLLLSAILGLYVIFAYKTGADLGEESAVKTWVQWGYLPATFLIFLKSVLVLFNADIEASNDLHGEDSHVEHASTEI